MNTVYKYPLDRIEHGPVTISFPEGSVVHIGRDPHGQWCAWVRIYDLSGPIFSLRVCMIGTGHPLPHGTWLHVSTVADGPFVWHFFVEHWADDE